MLVIMMWCVFSSGFLTGRLAFILDRANIFVIENTRGDLQPLMFLFPRPTSEYYMNFKTNTVQIEKCKLSRVRNSFDFCFASSTLPYSKNAFIELPIVYILFIAFTNFARLLFNRSTSSLLSFVFKFMPMR